MTRGHTNSAGFVKRKVLTALRTREQLSLREVARRAGISPSYLSKIEGGTKNPQPTVALALATALSVPLEAIYDLNPDSGFELYVLEVHRAV